MKPTIALSNSISNCSFLRDFKEESVEPPPDELNGDCVVHFGGEHSQYEMHATLVNGVREGSAVILNDGLRWMRVEYKGGSLMGRIDRFNDYGMVELSGQLVNGVEDGLFEEYDKEEKVIWRGYYRNGQRFREVTQVVKKGSNEYYELDENGRVIQLCWYENGVKSRVLASFTSDIMTEYDENGRKVFEGGYKGDMESGFVRDGFGKEYRLVKVKARFISKPEKKNWKKRFCCWVKESEHEVPGVEAASERYREKVNAGYWKDGKKNGMMCELDENESVKRGDWYESDKKKRFGEPWELLLMLLSIRTNICLINYSESVSLVITI